MLLVALVIEPNLLSAAVTDAPSPLRSAMEPCDPEHSCGAALLLAQGTGSGGCYFGRCEPEDEAPRPPVDRGDRSPDDHRDTRLELGYVTDVCEIGPRLLRVTEDGDVFSDQAGGSPDGRARFPGFAPQCFMDIESLITGVVFCVMRGSGAIFRGGPPPRGRFVGQCQPCRNGDC